MKNLSPALTELLLKQAAIEYIHLNSDLEVVGWSDGADRYSITPLEEGRAVVQCLPELGGMEIELEEVRLGQSEVLNFAKVNRKTFETLLYFNLTVRPLPLPTTQESGLVCFITDVTETATLEQSLTQQRNELSILRYRLEEQNAELVELNKIKSAFLGVVSHELRSPLSIVKGYLDIVLGGVAGPLNETQQQYLGRTANAVNRLLTLVNDLLDIERIESSTISLSLSTFSLPKLVRSVASNFELDLQNRKITLTIDNEQPDVKVQADMSRLEQVLTNFISNAIKYSPVGTNVTIYFELKDEQIITHIKDSGIGISEDDQKKLFQRFFRASNAASQGAQGSGLGLSIVKAIIERHGGQVWLESKLGEGSTFSFSLPLP